MKQLWIILCKIYFKIWKWLIIKKLEQWKIDNVKPQKTSNITTHSILVQYYKKLLEKLIYEYSWYTSIRWYSIKKIQEKYKQYKEEWLLFALLEKLLEKFL